MMRVTRSERRPGEPALQVEGRLTWESVEALTAACGAALDRHGTCELDLAALQFADAAGIVALRALARRGVRLCNGSALIAALLRDGAPEREAPDAGESADADEARLVAALRRGDEDAFETVVRRYGPRLLATARRLLPSESDARDVLQEALLAAFRSLPAFRGTARLGTWLHRIVVNAALMTLRRRRRRREESIETLLPRFDTDGRFAEPVAPWAAGAEALLERRETRLRVHRAIARLPERYRTVLVLREVEELDTAETAALLGISANAVKIRLHRARQALRTLLTREVADVAPRGDVRGEVGG